MKRLDESVPHTLGQIVINHGQSSLTDARLCESLLKDYCGEFKEEISLLVLGVKERVAIDLLVSHEAMERGVLRNLLTTRLRRHNSLTEGDARWVVDAWYRAVRELARTRTAVVVENSVSAKPSSPMEFSTAHQWTFGIISQCRSPMRSVAFSPVKHSVASGADDGCVRFWDAQTGETNLFEKCSGPVSRVRFSPSGVFLATISEVSLDKSRVRLWDLQANEPLDLGEVGIRSPSLAFSNGGTKLAAGSAEPDGVIRVWNLQSGQMQTLKAGGPGAISFSPDGKFLAAADATLSDVAIRLWDLDKGLAEVLGYSERQISAVDFSPEGNYVASGSWDETVRLWDVRTRKATVVGQECSCVNRLTFSPKADRLATWSLDGSIRIWGLPGDRPRTIGHCDNVNDIGFSTDGTVLGTAGADGTVRLWDARH